MSSTSAVTNAMTDVEIRAFVDNLMKEKGDNGLQQALQQRIQKTKKLESECAIMTKKAEAERRQADQLREESSKILTKARVLEQHCAALSKDVSEWPARREKRTTEWSERMGSVAANVDTEADALNKKMDVDDVLIKEKEAENVEMKAKFDNLRSTFDDAFKAYEESWKEREEKTKASIAELQELQQTNNLLKAQSLLTDKHVQRLTEGITSYSEQLEMYETRFGDVEATAMRSEDIKQLADKQQQQIQDQIDAVEANRKIDIEDKKRFDDEAQKLRSRIAQLKKKMPALEKAKTVAEAKCRDAQKQKK